MQATAIPPGRGLAAVLAVLVHLLFFALLVYSVNWKNHAPEPVMVELWQAPSVVAPVQRAAVEKISKPAPLQAQPATPNPDIALAKLKRKAAEQKTQQAEQLAQQQLLLLQKQLAKQQAQAKLAQQQLLQKQITEEKLAQEKLAAQQKIEQQQKKQATLRKMFAQQTQAQFQNESARALTSNRQAALASKQSAEQARMRAEYSDKIKAKIRNKIILPDGLQGNPQAQFEVLVLPTGEVVQVKLLHPSGQPAYDDAVDRAILKASPLPMPPDPALVGEFRDLQLNFSPTEN